MKKNISSLYIEIKGRSLLLKLTFEQQKT